MLNKPQSKDVGVCITGEIKKADEVQIDGEADVVMKTDNILIGLTGKCKGNIPRRKLLG